jgi:predicted alpha/beta hydrolase family esterase
MNTAKKFGMVISTSDKTVPTLNQERLKSLWKPEVVIYKDQDHFWTIVNTWLFDSDKIYAFFDS